MSFPIRHVHLPSPLHRCWPSPPPSDIGDDSPMSDSHHISRSPSNRRQSMDWTYFLPASNTPAPDDSSASLTFSCPPAHVTPARVALAWSVIRLRHPILASVGLMDPFGKVSYSYDPPVDIDAAVFDAEASLDYRRSSSASDLLTYYKTSTRRVSRSHLSHIFFSTSPTTTLLSPPLTPPPPNQDRPPKAVEHILLISAPHYVADNRTLAGYIDELANLLVNHHPHSANDLRVVLESEWRLAASKQSSPATTKPLNAPVPKMQFPSEGRFRRTVTA